MRKALWATSAMVCALWSAPALAGPPYLTDDPDPTPDKTYEILLFASGTRTAGDLEGDAGLDFNYGGGTNLQLTATIPASFVRPRVGPASQGLGDIELAAKYRLIDQADGTGWSVAVFPRVFVPAGPDGTGRSASFLLPVWVGHEGDGWSTFGGGGCGINNDPGGKSYCQEGWAFTRELADNFTMGAEVFHQGADTKGGYASTTLGVGGTYDVNDVFHILGWVGQGVSHPRQTGGTSAYTSVLFTF